MNVRDVMTSDVVATTPAARLSEVVELLAANGISGLPVVDADDNVVGVVSQTDVKPTAATAGEAMSSPALVVDETCSVTQAAARMLDRGVKRLPVVRGGKLVGIVTRRDLLRALTRSDEEIAREIRDDVLSRLFGLSPSEVAVSVDRGMVALCGQVERRSEIDAVEGLVLSVPGVVAVTASIGWKTDDGVPARS